MKRFEYMQMPIGLIPNAFIEYYSLEEKIHNNHKDVEIQRGLYGLSQAGKLENDLLRTRLAQHDYSETTMPGL